MLTLHVRSRAFPQLEDAAQFIKAIIGMYDVFMENKRIKAAQAVANLMEVDSTAAAAAVAAQAAALQADVQVRQYSAVGECQISCFAQAWSLCRALMTACVPELVYCYPVSQCLLLRGSCVFSVFVRVIADFKADYCRL